MFLSVYAVVSLVVGAVVSLVAMLYWRQKAYKVAELTGTELASLKESAEEMREDQSALATVTQELRDRAEKAEADAIKAREMAEREKRRADEQFQIIEGVVNEKHYAWRMYRESAQAAGVAQTWLMRELVTKTQMLNQARKKLGEDPVAIDPKLREVVEDFGARVEGIPAQAPSPEQALSASGAGT